MGFVGTTYVLVALYFLCVNLPKTLAEDEQKEHKFIVDKLVKEIESNDILTTDLKLDKNGNEVKISGEIKQLVDFDDDWKVGLIIKRADKSDGEYEKVVALPPNGVCQLMKSIYKKYFYDTLKNYANAPEPDKCAVTKDTYKIKDYPVDSSKFRKNMKPGHYRIEATLLKDSKEIMKYVVLGHTEEAK